MTDTVSMERILQELVVPPSFARRDGVPLPEEAKEWKRRVSARLDALNNSWKDEADHEETKVRAVSTACVFTYDVEWTTPSIRQTASGMLCICLLCPH